ncbi:hypothetical protein BCV69DRAFT_43379 [Microstroma glucosiphilum]|uniref:Uncharacterized protein n=1 Tax=Pseudomicrostroma glucosiphilum TaxID=1684307 RepID=A0A316U2K2_9BASI|nr:hypothetical protein BCV69DRAFT_43379 [Pseudomicrostroma glucosiphilum]PWN19569.1 hypothetical protein BCV69DRAFT_43379 [Pseudomicrostroma glucosiphilum]
MPRCSHAPGSNPATRLECTGTWGEEKQMPMKMKKKDPDPMLVDCPHSCRAPKYTEVHVARAEGRQKQAAHASEAPPISIGASLSLLLCPHPCLAPLSAPLFPSRPTLALLGIDRGHNGGTVQCKPLDNRQSPMANGSLSTLILDKEQEQNEDATFSSKDVLSYPRVE